MPPERLELQIQSLQINMVPFNNIAQDLNLSGQILKYEKVIFYHGDVYRQILRIL